eukprot:11618203-Ditylum_brightwellii.AAC.1
MAGHLSATYTILHECHKKQRKQHINNIRQFFKTTQPTRIPYQAQQTKKQQQQQINNNRQVVITLDIRRFLKTRPQRQPKTTPSTTMEFYLDQDRPPQKDSGQVILAASQTKLHDFSHPNRFP